MRSLLFRFARRVVRRVSMFPLHLQSLGIDSFIERPYKISHPDCIQVGARTKILSHSWLVPIKNYADQAFEPRLVIGDDVYIGHRCCITCINSVAIGNGCVLSEEVYIADSSHGYNPDAGLIMRQRLQSRGPVVLEEHCFVGYRAVISPGVRLGRHSVVGANAVVTKSVPPFSMVAGTPARLIKRYDPEVKLWVDCAKRISA